MIKQTNIGSNISMRILAIVVLLAGCLTKPNQPALTFKEQKFIDSLSYECRCKVDIDIDVILLGRFAKTHERGGYGLTLIFKCDDLKWLNEHRDSAKRKSDQLVKPLYKALEENPKFNEITISFTCNTDLANSSKYQDIFYNYNTDSLIKK